LVSGDWARQLFAILTAVIVMAIGIAANYFEVLGMGDVKLASAISLIVAYLNLYLPVIAIGTAFVLAFAVVLVLLFRGKAKLGSSIPLGPYLLLSFIGSMVCEITMN
jgi:leader peptidase (prepilin peptidase)/N-methyltransferase